jgi:hypothetical protein
VEIDDERHEHFRDRGETQMTPAQSERPRVQLRLPKRLDILLREAASAQGISLNGFLELAIRNTLGAAEGAQKTGKSMEVFLHGAIRRELYVANQKAAGCVFFMREPDNTMTKVFELD